MSVLPAGGLAETRRGGAAWFLLVALLSGLGAAWLAVRGVAQARRETPVLMARREVAPLTRIGPGDVGLAEVPVAAVPPGALRSAAAVQGRFTRLGLVPGEIVTATALQGGVATASAFDLRLASLAGTGDCRPGASPAPGTVAGGCRRLVAMSVPVSPDQGFPMVRSGDSVDLVAAYPVRVGTVSQVIATDVPVLERVASSQAGVPGATGDASSGWLVLAVSPDEALRLQLALSTGKIAVLLEPPGAPPEPASLAARIMDVSGLAGGGVPAAPPVAGALPSGGGG